MDPNIVPDSEPVIIDESVSGSNESSSSKTKIWVIFGSAIILLLLSVIGLLTYQIMTLNEEEAIVNTDEQEQVEPEPISDVPEENDEVAEDVDPNLYLVEEWGMAFDNGDRAVSEDKGEVYSNVANENPVKETILSVPYMNEDFTMCNDLGEDFNANLKFSRYPTNGTSDLEDFFWSYYFPEVFGGVPDDKASYSDYYEFKSIGDIDVLVVSSLAMGSPLSTYVFVYDSYFYILESAPGGEGYSGPLQCFHSNLGAVSITISEDILKSVVFE